MPTGTVARKKSEWSGVIKFLLGTNLTTVSRSNRRMAIDQKGMLTMTKMGLTLNS